MKKLLLIAGLLISLNGMSQKNKENTIIAAGVTFRQAVNVLLDNGYIIDKLDSNFYTIKTEYKKFCPDCLPQILLNIRIKDTFAVIKGTWKSDGGILAKALVGHDVDEMFFDVMNEKGKVPQMCFKEMDRIAKLLSSNVTYTKQ